MNKLLLAILTVIVVTTICPAQTAKPSPTPNEEPGVVKISTNLIQIDVSVTDRKGNVVKGLNADDFEIFENGQKQPISNFSFVSAGDVKTAARTEPAEKDSVPVPTLNIRSEQVHRTISLVVDDLGLSFDSAYFTRRALKKFVDEQMQAGDLVAIIRTSAGTGALQQFTADKRILYAAIERVRWYPSGRGGISAFAPIEPTPLQQAAASGDAVSEEDLENESNFNNSVEDFRNSSFAVGTLGAIRYIIGGMRELPGRKSVILFSEGFRLYDRDSGSQVLDFMRFLVDAANRASVVVYTIDPRGLQTLAITAQDQIISSQAAQDAYTTRRDELFETQSGLSYLAEQTGGFAVLNNNDLAGGLRRVLNDQSYYLIGYEPDSDTFDAAKRRFNKITVKVKRSDLLARYRSGFFNVAEEKLSKPRPVGTVNDQLTAALLSPFSVNDISLSLNTIFGNSAQKGNFVRSLLYVDANDLTFVDTPDGKKKAEVSVLGVIFDDNGAVVDQLGRNHTLLLSESDYKTALARGFVYNFVFPLKNGGAYQYRVVLRDSGSARTGSASQFIEVPNLKKGNIALSSIIVQGFSMKQWPHFEKGEAALPDEPYSSPMDDTSRRRFKSGSVLTYGLEIYNAKQDVAKPPNLITKIRVFREGKLILDGEKKAYPLRGQTDVKHLKLNGAMNLSGSLAPGDYVLQVVVIDLNAKLKKQIASQHIQFEVVDR